MPAISEAELEVMKVLWDRGRATSPQIVEALEGNTGWHPKTIRTLIARLDKKGAVTCDRSEKVFVYRPAVDPSQYRIEAGHTLLKKLYDGSMSRMLAAFIQNKALPPEELAALRKLLDEEA